MNNRVFYAIQAVGMSTDGGSTWTTCHGVQSCGITTTFNLTQVFEMGQLALYQLLEEIPDIEATLEKVIDGNPLLYHLATQGAVTGTLTGRGVVQTTLGLAVFPETQLSASGTPIAEVHMSGMVPSSMTYTASVDGPSTESLTLVGYNKVWIDVENGGSSTFAGTFTSNADAPNTSVMRRENVLFTPFSGSPTGVDVNGQTNAFTTVLPTDIFGISTSGTNDVDPTTGFPKAKVQSISVSADLGRNAIYELGRRMPYNRYIGFPIEVKTDIETISTKFDNISATEAGGNNGAPAGSDLRNQTIRVQFSDGTRIDTGPLNKLQSVAYQGGDATSGGGNVSLRYSYVTYNDLNVFSPVDPSDLP